MLKSISDIRHVLYINLAERTDRHEHILKQMTLIGLNPFAQRFDAIKLRQGGALGCSVSHLKCLQLALNNRWDHVLICEDDILFSDPELFIAQFNKCLQTINDDWDVIMLAGNNVPPYQTINDSCVKITKCLTTTGYLVKRAYMPKLIQNIQEGIHLFMSNLQKPQLYAIDVFWSQLQVKDRWLLVTPLTVVQKEGHSDIEQRHTNYEKLMRDLDKAEWVKRQGKH
jgi:glycosyl transferase family 25